METLEELKKEIERQRALREEAEARALDERRQREEAEARALDEKLQREKVEKVIAKSTYHNFLSLCHQELYSDLTVQDDPALSASGKLTKVDSKYYPLHLKKWDDFLSLHDACQAHLESLFDDKAIFPSVNGIETIKGLLALDRPLADENDVRQFQFFAVEGCARIVLSQYLEENKRQLSQEEQDSNQNEDNESTARPVRFYFANEPYGILLDESEDMDENDHSGTTPAYKPAMLAAQQKDAESRGRSAGEGPQPAKRNLLSVRKFHPDQWLMRVDSNNSIVPVFIVEYKAAHKLRASALKLALLKNEDEPQDLFVAAIREQYQETTVQDSKLKEVVDAEKATARVIAQTFHYMVEFGLCYAYVASGEALLLLYLDPADVRTLQYHLSLPCEEIGMGSKENVRRTPVSLVPTMALLALDKRPLSQKWKKNAESLLKRWPTPYDEISFPDESSHEEEDTEKLKTAPQPRPAKGQQGCREEDSPQQRRRKEDDDGSDQVFPAPEFSRAFIVSTQRKYKTRFGERGGGSSSSDTTRQHKPLPYCSQACILGLRNEGLLDHSCPNVRFHSAFSMDNRHGLTAIQLCHRLRQQLADDLDENCDALDKFGKFGAIGMLFRLTLQDYGYCVVAKGVQRAHRAQLEQEVAMYNHLQAQQGTLVPMCLGIIDLVQDYRTSHGAHIFYMMLMAYGGESLDSKAARPLPDNIQILAWDAWAQLRKLGVEQGDEREPNLLWNAELQRLMCIDFEHAKIVERKRKRKYKTEIPSSPVLPRRQWLGVEEESKVKSLVK